MSRAYKVAGRASAIKDLMLVFDTLCRQSGVKVQEFGKKLDESDSDEPAATAYEFVLERLGCWLIEAARSELIDTSITLDELSEISASAREKA